MARLANMPNAENCTLKELETAAGAAISKRSHVRLMAIKALVLGFPHDKVAALYNFTRRTLCRWVKDFNDRGIDGLIQRRHTRRRRKITTEQTVVYEELIRHPEGPIRPIGLQRSFTDI